ncbi:MAG TPA: sugar phosphate nucleotidyltransferase [Gemmatimonadota bacterium]|nr:sugar phosphate nucleotidyltransferase [Gemmatimonadota bacterium]
MDAMILAAGLGTRLRPLTDHTPKALVEVGGVPILEHIARRLVAAGADRIIVNAHRHADQVEGVAGRLGGELGVEVLVSLEDEKPLETGGGLLHAASLFRKEAPSFLHNGDIVTGIDLAALYAAHGEDRLATLAVGRRETARYLLFDEEGLLGWENLASGRSLRCRTPVGDTARWPFAGIHVIWPSIFDRITERGVFSILDVYLRLAAEGARILPWDVGDALWLEIGNPERLERARQALATRERGDAG